MLYAFNVIIV